MWLTSGLNLSEIIVLAVAAAQCRLYELESAEARRFRRLHQSRAELRRGRLANAMDAPARIAAE